MRTCPAVCLLLVAGCGRPSTGECIEQLRAKDAAVRLHAVRALGERRSEAASVVPALAAALKDEDSFVRRDAARALGRIGPGAEAAVPALRAGLADRKPNVRKAAAEALQKISPGADRVP